MEILIYSIFAIIGLVGLYLLIKFLIKKNVFAPKVKTNVKKEKKIEKSENITLVEKYMYRREIKVLIALNQILPRTYLSLPKVAVGKITQPEGSKIIYNKYKDFFVDFVVFEEATMKPLAVVDVYDNSFDDELIKDRYPELLDLFTFLGLPVVSIAVRNEVDNALLKEKMYSALKIDASQTDKK